MKTQVQVQTKSAKQARLILLVSAFFMLIAALAMLPVRAAGLPDFTELVEKVGPSVVNIRTTERTRVNSSGGGSEEEMQELFRRFFGQPMPGAPNSPNTPRRAVPPGEGREVPSGVGSGFILTADGFIMTNHHVVNGADEIYVTLTDKRELKGRVVGSDQRTDVAIVKIEATGLPAVRIGDVNRLKVGEWVLAIGSPFGLDSTVTAGIVSAKQRETGELLPFIQTDVAINPGNSGGPLLNMRGEVVGINSQILSRTGTFAGVSFSIPIDEATRVGDQLRSSGRVTRGRMGLFLDEMTKDLAETLGLSKPTGAVVARVERDGPAEKAGVQSGDVILKYDGRPVERSSELRRFAANTKPGTRVNLEVLRGGKTREVALALGELEAPTPVRRAGAEREKPAATVSNFLGIAVTELSEAQKRDPRNKGVVVEAVEGAAQRTSDIRAGDIILAVQDTDVSDTKQFNAAVAALPKDRAVRLLVRRGETSRWIIVRPAQR